jgi:peptide deformylase
LPRGKQKRWQMESPWRVNQVILLGMNWREKTLVRQIMRDPLFLAQESKDATEADGQVVTDLLDTLRANLDRCVGMAANMIGVRKNIIVVAAGPFQFAMINPVITKKTGAFQTEEGCLSLDGVRPCTRYKEIEVDYLDQNFKRQHGRYSGWTAQIIQHEVDHCRGIVI